ncbi:unnamed protein product [Mytilus coruscus]|uniref:Ig-like domain-containing protein n=1 Tax=Mytilus coruscus TaxID=42192 RepID=A0A6J8A384_MYTCO|nr:unnamed protein product [Mytilus coruscus]
MLSSTSFIIVQGGLTDLYSGADNRAIVRCFVETDVSTVIMYADSEPMLIHFKVRSPSIALLPNKTVCHEGDSVKLECKAFGNPNPSYTWIKGNRSNETIVFKDSFVIEHANISDSGFYTCDTSNSIDGKVYTEYLSTYIDIADRPTTPFSATLSPAGSDNTKGNLS